MKSSKVIKLLQKHQNEINDILSKGHEQFLTDILDTLVKNNVKDRQYIYFQLWQEGEERRADYCSNREIIDYHYFSTEDIFKDIKQSDLNKEPLKLIDTLIGCCIIKALEYKYFSNKQCLVILDPQTKNIATIVKDYYEF